jgi:hypothetical protein
MTINNTLIKQNTSMPTRKMQAAALGGAIATVLMGGIAVFFPESYERVPPGMEGGLATIFAIMGGWIARERA